MNKRKAMLNSTFLIFLMLMLLGANAQNIAINIGMKDGFSAGDEVFFDYTISANSEEEITFNAYVNCPNAPLPLQDTKTISVSPKTPYSGKFNYLQVNESIESQICSAYVEIISPVYLREEKTFCIETDPAIELEINACKDAECKEKAKVFKQGETIYLVFNSSTENLTIDANLEFPDKTTKQISLPYSFKAEQLGTYNLTVTASKEGYRPTGKTTQFGVIEKEPKTGKKDFNFYVGVCKEKNWIDNPKPIDQVTKICTNPSKEFSTGTKIVIYTGASDIKLTAPVIVKIVFPDGTKREIEMKELSTKTTLEQKGTYIIEAHTHPSGYREKTEIITIEVKEAGPPVPPRIIPPIFTEIPIEYIVAIVAAIVLILIAVAILLILKVRKMSKVLKRL